MAEQTISMDGYFKKELAEATKRRADPPRQRGFVNLPGGVVGVAKAMECGFCKIGEGKQNAGKIMFRAKAAMVVPKTVVVNGAEMPCTMFTVTYMENTFHEERSGRVTTQQEHLDNIVEFFKRCGLREQIARTSGPISIDRLIAAWNELAKKGVLFIDFSTREMPKRTPTDKPKVVEDWIGVTKTDLSKLKQQAASVRDNTASGTNGSAKSHGSDDSDDGGGDESDDGREEAGGSAAEALDLDLLVEKAEKRDKEAQRKLKSMAMDAGMTDREADDAETWQSLADYVRNGSSSGGSDDSGEPHVETSDEGGEPAAREPEVGDVVKYRFDGSSRMTTCRVTAVNAKTETLDLVSKTDPKKSASKVGWDEVVAAD